MIAYETFTTLIFILVNIIPKKTLRKRTSNKHQYSILYILILFYIYLKKKVFLDQCVVQYIENAMQKI